MKKWILVSLSTLFFASVGADFKVWRKLLTYSKTAECGDMTAQPVSSKIWAIISHPGGK